MIEKILKFLISVLFDFSYERELLESLVFYFFYLIFEGCLVFGLGFYCYNKNIDFDFFFNLLQLVPFIFCTTFALSFMFKKNLKDAFSIFLVILTVFLTVIFPNLLGFYIGLIPVTILSTKEDCSLNKEIQKMEQEKLEHEQWIEKQLLTERAIASKLGTIRKHENNKNEKEVSDETE